MGKKMNRSGRAACARDTLAKIEAGTYTINGLEVDISVEQTFAVDNTKVYTPTELIELMNEPIEKNDSPTIFNVIDQTVMAASMELLEGDEGHEAKVGCLNFASAKNAGGGVLSGAGAAEESICRASGLYPCLEPCSTYYATNRRTKDGVYTDHLIYSPLVPCIKNDDGCLLYEKSLVSFITMPAVNAGVVRKRYTGDISVEQYITQIMSRRIRMVLHVAAKQGLKRLVLGAWGAGVFQNDVDMIASEFAEALQNPESPYHNVFEKVTFAVYSSNPKFIKPFNELFCEQKEETE
ncbi:hypothetical protein PCE1_004392 [Barthelona sp. PCE]